MTSSELTALLRLLNQRGATRWRWRRLIHELWRQSGSLAAVVQALPEQQRLEPSLGEAARSLRRDHASVEAEITRQLVELARHRLTVLAATDPAFPERVRAIPDPPLALFMAGNPALLSGAAVAMVGSRRPTRYGARLAERFAREMAQAGLVVVSGLAEGIDGSAHRGALAAGGYTVAVLGSGHGRPYPRQHQRLARRITDCGGAVISEYPPTWHARKHQFPERNRLISGLAHGVIVVEASERSGSLITARLALEQGRDVMAVPGPARAASHRGCHWLIREGAALVETADDALAVLGLEAGAAAHPGAGIGPERTSTLDATERRLLESLGSMPASVDELRACLDLPVGETLQHLAMLELKGFVEACEGGYIRRPF